MASNDVAIDRRVERAEEEEAILKTRNRASDVEAGVVAFLMENLSVLVRSQVVGLLARCLKALRLEEAVDASVILRAARLGDDVDNAASRLTILRLEADRLDLDFLM